MKPITDVLMQYRNGRAVELISRDFAECVRAVDETGQSAELTIKIKIEPEKGGGSQKDLSIKRTAKLPKTEIPKAVFFSDPEGDLHRTDPRQGDMFSDASSRSGRA
jgi:hypothetical protein